MKKNLILYALLIIYIILNVSVITASMPLYNEVINPLLWIGLCAVAVFLSRGETLRVKDEGNKTQSLIIALIIYSIFYFLLGLVFGYQRTPYSKDLFSIIKNLWSFVGIIFFQEYIRNAMVRIEKKKVLNFILITIIFAVVNISFGGMIDRFKEIKDAFIYTTSVLIPLFVTSGVLTYLSYIGGARLPIIYRLFMTVPEFILPIIPGLDSFVTAVLGVAAPLAVFVYLNFVHVSKTERMTKRAKRKYNPVIYVPTFIFIGVVVCFVIGVFKYQPIAVLSGSMSPTFNRGDAVVIRKIGDEEKSNLKKGDVIQFVNGSKYVIHRIVNLTTDEYGNRRFITKGDANNANDVDKVKYDDIIGKVSFIVPFVGYPSVWLSGMVS